MSEGEPGTRSRSHGDSDAEIQLPEINTDPEIYVRENHDTLVRIIIHGTDNFVRSLALAALVEYGSESDVGEIKRLVDRWGEEVSV